VGAGIAGLVTAKVMQEDGFAVTIFERGSDIGGVWNPARVYPGLKANNSRLTYAFSDFPYPDTADEFPTAPQIYAYLRAYMEQFNLEPLLHLSSTVTSITRSSNPEQGRFKIVVQPTNDTDVTETHFFDFVAICNGVHSVPNLPQIEDQEQFAGPRLHSSQFGDPNMIKGKRVIVVGGAKSALDCANAAAKHGSSVTLVLRSAHWMFPRHLFGMPADNILNSLF
jgi:cation diffusion facilitator CzcD-associated flavoprotein CzcO